MQQSTLAIPSTLVRSATTADELSAHWSSNACDILRNTSWGFICESSKPGLSKSCTSRPCNSNVGADSTVVVQDSMSSLTVSASVPQARLINYCRKSHFSWGSSRWPTASRKLAGRTVDFPTPVGPITLKNITCERCNGLFFWNLTVSERCCLWTEGVSQEWYVKNKRRGLGAYFGHHVSTRCKARWQ